MEISAVSVSEAVSSSWYSSFSDQSHLQFYGHGRSRFLNPCKLRLKIPSCRLSASKPVMAPVRAFCNSPSVADTEHTAEEALMKELADLKLQMKQKKKELKAHMKEDKRKHKRQMKEEKKRKKQKDAEEGKGNMKCQSESSSSSSESCDEECSSVSMKILRQTQSTHEDAGVNGEGCPVLENSMATSAVSASSVCALSMNDSVEDCDGYHPSFLSLSSEATEACLEKSSMVFLDKDILTVASMGSFNGCTSRANVISDLEILQKHATENGEMSPCKKRVDSRSGVMPHVPSGVMPHVPSSLHVCNRIEVCSGGKCKKARSEELLLALQGQIPWSANVEAVSCKCMGKCSMGINVRVHKEGTNAQHHSHVGVEDGSLILSHHFGVGCPSVGLPILSPEEGIRAPLPLVIA